jgi:AbrB family looped-hinge helix DNA binding protein
MGRTLHPKRTTGRGFAMNFEYLRNSYIGNKRFLNGEKMSEAYVCKVTSVGQVTLPKEVRKKLEIRRDDYIIIEKIGNTYFMRKIEAESDMLEKIRNKIKKSGITKEKLDKIIEEVRKEVWSETYGKSLRRR